MNDSKETVTNKTGLMQDLNWFKSDEPKHWEGEWRWLPTLYKDVWNGYPLAKINGTSVECHWLYHPYSRAGPIPKRNRARKRKPMVGK